MKIIKKIFLSLLIIITVMLAMLLIATFIFRDRLILSGYYDSEEYWDKDGFQDYTDYCKYYYDSKYDNVFKRNSSYEKVEEKDIENLVGYFNDFSKWMSNRNDEYDFDTKYITKGDYVAIKTKENEKIGNSYYEKYDNYTIYLYDIETHTLYYIHNNI